MLLDVAKYVFTIVVIGGLVAGSINFENILFGLTVATGLMAIGFHTIPTEEEHHEQL